MEEKTLKTLEFNKIRELLADYTVCDETKEKARCIVPKTVLSEVNSDLSMSDAAVVMVLKYGSPPLMSVSEVTSSLKRISVGGTLSMPELLNIAKVLACASGLKKYYDGHEGVLDRYFEALEAHNDIETRISSSIISETEMADGASAELANIRRKIARMGDKIKDTLNSMIRSPHYQKFLQDPIVTLRNDRYVLPVKAEHKGDVQGIVHDVSASGGTLFIEPSGVVDANNELHTLAAKEKTEIERILAELTAVVAEISDAVKWDYEAICNIDLQFAKAKLGIAQKGVCPQMNDKGNILIKSGRHPLIDPKRVVPQDISLGIDFDTLVVTGPNTGGKTVLLKTVGLLSLMAQSGLYVPAGDGTILSVFDGIYADIGDEQSIEQSLSTFSSHMTNIVGILNKITPDSLVLFDELGAGTDPTEGAALATAILNYVKNLGAKTVATTHYSELKVYALSTEKVENGSCEFDVETLSPTYRLLVGVPGKSNAFAISKKLGLSDFIIEDSKQLLSKESIKFEDILTDIEKNRKITEISRVEQERLKKEVQDIKAELVRERRLLDKKRDEIFEKANKKAAEIIEQAKAETDEILEKMRALKKEKDEKEALKAMEEVRKDLNIRIKKTVKTKNSSKPKLQKININALKPGMSVLMVDINDKGTILTIDKKAETAVIQMGIMKTTSKLSNLVILEDETQKNIARFIPRKETLNSTKTVKTEVDLRGMILEEALMETDMFLDRAAMSGLNTVTVIHGKGTGVLRQGVHDMLRKHPHVKSFRLGKYGEGENGVTVVELKNS
ncbi:MAG: endonuclease MutS2 [Clostridia bacterium]|nr:endonuclease MutS2 [Clostridia bacterium]